MSQTNVEKAERFSKMAARIFQDNAWTWDKVTSLYNTSGIPEDTDIEDCALDLANWVTAYLRNAHEKEHTYATTGRIMCVGVRELGDIRCEFSLNLT